MADGLEITVDGMPEFNKAMEDLAGPGVERIIRRAMRNGGRVIQAAITEAAPVRPDLPSGTALPPGALKNDIVVRVTKEQDGSISAYIAPGKLTRHAAVWTEFGHEMVVGGRKGKGRTIGQVPPHPFIRPAFEESELAAQDAIATTIAAAFGGYLEDVEAETHELSDDDEGFSIGPGGTVE